MRGREARFLRWREAGQKGENYATLYNISQSKICKGGNNYRAETGIKRVWEARGLDPLSPAPFKFAKKKTARVGRVGSRLMSAWTARVRGMGVLCRIYKFQNAPIRYARKGRVIQRETIYMQNLLITCIHCIPVENTYCAGLLHDVQKHACVANSLKGVHKWSPKQVLQIDPQQVHKEFQNQPRNV